MRDEPACFLGIDCGTQSTKAVLVDAGSGAVRGVATSPHRLDLRPDGTSEQDPLDWVEAAVTAVRAVLAEVTPAEVRGIGVSGQQHGLVALDAAGVSVRPAKLWNDTTTGPECGLLTDAVGGPEAAIAATGNRFLTGYTAPKLLWLRRHEPERYAAATRFCLPHDYLNLWLTGTFATEPGDASGTAYFDVRERRYAEAVLAAIDPDRDWTAALPPVAESLSTIGELTPATAERLGLARGIPVTAGGGDNMCAALGVGVVDEGALVVSLGTSGTAFGRRDEPAVDPLGEVSAFCDSAGGWLPLACVLNCAGVVDWARSLAGGISLEAALAASPPGADGLTLLPYLVGERTPDLPRASGTFCGLRLDHDGSDVVRAAVEGVTFGVAFALEALARTGTRAERLLLVGGGGQSDAWAQLLADVTGMPVERPAVAEAAAAGAAAQARWVVDGQRPRPAVAERAWEPRVDGRLGAALDRHVALRALALEGRLA
jgi:xylulokinase